MMKVGLARRMRKRPIRFNPANLFNHSRQAKRARAVKRQLNTQFIARCAELARDVQRGDARDLRHTAAVTVKPICCPAPRRREIIFAITCAACGFNKGLKTGCLPQPVSTDRFANGGKNNVRRPASHAEAQSQTVRPFDLDDDPGYGVARAVGMAHKVNAFNQRRADPAACCIRSQTNAKQTTQAANPVLSAGAP